MSKVEFTWNVLTLVNRGGLKHMKVDNKAVRQYENVNDEDHCVVNIFEKILVVYTKA